MRRGVTPQWPRPHKVFNPQWPHPPLTPSPDSPQWPVCPSPMGLPPALLLVLCLYPAPQGLAPPDPGLLAQGRARLREAQTLAQHPQLGACWAGALGRLDGGCQQLGEEQQSRIALAFAHCHLQRSGRPFPRCEASSSVRACTQHMDPVAFGVYTEFFTHAHSICYLLRSEAWQQQAESTVHRLVASSEGVAERLEETNQLAEQAARAQEATLRSQEEILRHGELLRQTLQDSSRGVREAFRDMQEAAGRQRLAFAEIVNRLSFLHRFLVGESQALGSFLYHLLTSSAALLLTSSQRTAGARTPAGPAGPRPQPGQCRVRRLGLPGAPLPARTRSPLGGAQHQQPQEPEPLPGPPAPPAAETHQPTGLGETQCSCASGRAGLLRSPAPAGPERPPANASHSEGAPLQRPKGKNSVAGGRCHPAEPNLGSDSYCVNVAPSREPGLLDSLPSLGGSE
ncbi:uncharacterized protein LOC119564925 isoform X6 [Chelonia mydas]|uniref:uncharacterized protein LOC119564925 isoform X6 n=1 Tax=Chelonia mydas TaxID=8469 RepID=UPI001CA8E534|nr:uncharacterized protein LOC119564925 isoform X6 [Chelonia mydas]